MAKGKYQKWLEPDKLLLLESWARDGLTDEQIALKLGINVGTLYVWKNKYHEIDEALKKGKEVIDVMVENALLKRALGYEYEEQQVVKYKEGCEIVTVIKYAMPDVTAQIFWLKNRRSEQWREKQQVDIRGSLDKLDEVLGKVEDNL